MMNRLFLRSVARVRSSSSGSSVMMMSLSNTIRKQQFGMPSLSIRNFASNSSNSKADNNAELFDSKHVTRLSTTNESADKIVTKTLMESEDNVVRDTVVHQMVTVNGSTFDVNDCWVNTKVFMSIIDGIHSVGLPWWLTLFATVVALRLSFTPLMVLNLRNSAKMTTLQPKMAESSDAIKRAQSKEEKVRLQMQMMTEMRTAGFRPFRPILFALVQIPFYITAFRAQSVLVQLRAEETAVGGILWFTDLHVPDATYGLPVLSSILMLASFELGAEGIAEKYRRIFRILMRTFAVISVPLVGWLPAATCFFIVSHNVFSLCWSLLMRVSSFRVWLGLPAAPPKITFGVPPPNTPPPPPATRRFYNAESGRIEEKPNEKQK